MRLNEQKPEGPIRRNEVKMISLLQNFSQTLICAVIHQGVDTEAHIPKRFCLQKLFIFVLFFFGTFTLRNVLEGTSMNSRF